MQLLHRRWLVLKILVLRRGSHLLELVVTAVHLVFHVISSLFPFGESIFDFVFGCFTCFLSHLLAGVAKLVEATQGGLHGFVALRLGVESQLEERLEQDVLEVLCLLPAEGQFDVLEVLLVQETLRLFTVLVLIVVVADELAVRITKRGR